MKKISVIVPVYNSENYIDECLNSLINQTLKDIEIIIINDGSIDNSEKIIKNYKKKYSNIIYVKKENEGQGIARNVGLKKANGEYVSFVDSDDYLPIDALEKLYNAAKESSADIVCSSQIIKIENGEKTILKQDLNDDLSLKKRFIITNVGPCNKIIKKDLIVKNNLLFPKIRYYEDLAIVPVWGLFAKSIVMINEPTYFYLVHDGSTMHQLSYNKNFDDIFLSLENLSNNFKTEFKVELEWLYISHLLHYASLRYMQFNKFDKIDKIVEIIKNKYSKWYRNKYLKKEKIKYKIICYLLYKRKYRIVKKLLKNR